MLRRIILLAVLGAVGCHGSDGQEPKQGADDVSLSAGAITPRDMNQRQWAEYAQAQQAVPSRDVRRFTPVWSGFATPPTGDFKYAILGEVAIIWGDQNLTTGISNATDFSFSGGPTELIPVSRTQIVIQANDSAVGNIQATAQISNSGPTLTVAFAINEVSGTHIIANSAGWTAAGLKYLVPGFVVIYPLR